jgi:hypothetical protein
VSAKIFWLILAGLAIAGIVWLRFHAGSNLQGIDPGQGIDPHASEEIEKAKQR